MRTKNFAAFILTHGRPDSVITYGTLRRSGYTGRIVVLIDNEDSTAGEYAERFGDEVHTFDKAAVAKTFDTGDLSDDRRTIVYARNACFKIAEELGIERFIQLDDDYVTFLYRVWDGGVFKGRLIRSLDQVFDLLVEYRDKTGALTVAMAQGGDFMGGSQGTLARTVKVKRKAMNTFVCGTDRPFTFVGRINEDVNTYTLLGSRGGLFLTVPVLQMNQPQTQSSGGGMTDAYLDGGTYLKSFFSVMYCPSCVTVSDMGTVHRRLHHQIDWPSAVPMILDETHRRR